MSISRRDFLKATVVTGAVVTAGQMTKEAEAATPPIDTNIAGVYDLHVHADPDVRARCIDQLTLSRQMKQNGYAGVMFKCHDFITVDNAYLLRAMVPDFEIFGGITLNANYGPKVNVQAAKMAATMLTGRYCRCIWLPTYQSAYDAKEKGVPVTDGNGKVLPEVVQVMEICRDENIIFATGHSSPQEVIILTAKAKEVGVKKCVVTHATQEPWYLTMDQAKAAMDNGAYLEHSILPFYYGVHSAISGNWNRRHTSMADFAKYIKIAPDRQFIDTDLGQALNPNPIDGMRAFIQGLRAEGITNDQIDKLTRKIPAMLMDVSRSTL